MTGSHHDGSVDGVLEGDVHRGVVSLVQLHLDLTVRHTVEADVKLNVHRLGHLNFNLENSPAPTSCDPLRHHLGSRAHVETDVDGGVVGFGLLYLDIASHRVVVPDVYGVTLGTLLARI